MGKSADAEVPQTIKIAGSIDHERATRIDRGTSEIGRPADHRIDDHGDVPPPDRPSTSTPTRGAIDGETRRELDASRSAKLVRTQPAHMNRRPSRLHDDRAVAQPARAPDQRIVTAERSTPGARTNPYSKPCLRGSAIMLTPGRTSGHESRS